MNIARLNVTVVGLGLMGGSVALAVRPFVGRITAVDSDAATRELAQAKGIVDAVTADLAQGVAGADLIVLATPVRTILRLLGELPHLRPDGCLVLDLGSTKGEITAAMTALPASFAAIGGHPMCGRENAGLAWASGTLFREATFILCRNERTTAAIEQLALALIEQIGARPLFMDGASHDELVGLVSHVPYVLAAVLLQQAAAHPDERIWTVSASGFRDNVRLAGSDPAMMGDILLTNRELVCSQLEQVGQELAAVVDLLRNDKAGLRAWLVATQGRYQLYRNFKRET